MTEITTAFCPEHRGAHHSVVTDGANVLRCAEADEQHDTCTKVWDNGSERRWVCEADGTYAKFADRCVGHR